MSVSNDPGKFVILNIGHWNVFVIGNLVFFTKTKRSVTSDCEPLRLVFGRPRRPLDDWCQMRR
jgi:hypothetical protein